MKNGDSRFRSLSWRINIILITGTGVVAISALLFISSFLTQQLIDGLKQKCEAVALLLSANLSAAVEFDDKDVARETMMALKLDREFSYAIVTAKDGKEFVTLGKMPKPRPSNALAGGDATQIIEMQGLICVRQPILRNKELVGGLELGFSLADIYARSQRIRIGGILVCALLILVLTLYFAYAMNRTIVRPISHMTRFVQKIGRGDLSEYTFAAQRKSETLEIKSMQEALETTTSAFRSNVQSIQTASNEFATIANRIMDSSSKLADAAAQQVEKVVDAVSSAKTMEAVGEQSADSALTISNAAKTSVAISGEGLSVVSDSFKQFHNVRDQSQIIVDAVEKLNALLSQIDQIVVSVADLARQSQLLAVNAAIEAAKAGKVGFGFAVVAKHIKELALQSKSATNTVRGTLGSVKTGIKNIADVSADGHRRASQGLSSIEGGGEVIKRLAKVINNTAQAAEIITNNTETQVMGLREMSKAMSMIDYLSKSDSDAVKALEDYGEDLAGKARDMEQLVSQFRIE
jgi:methyl-accepting chemotaxis protein